MINDPFITAQDRIDHIKNDLKALGLKAEIVYSNNNGNYHIELIFDSKEDEHLFKLGSDFYEYTKLRVE